MYRLVGANEDVWPGLLFDETGSVTFRCDKVGPITILKDDYSRRFQVCDDEPEEKDIGDVDDDDDEKVADEDGAEATTKKEEEEEETTTTTKEEEDETTTTTTTTVEATIVKSDKKDRIVLSDKESIYTLSEKDIGRYVTIRIRELKDKEEKIPCTMKWTWEVQGGAGGDDWTPVDENISESLESVFREGSARAVGLFYIT